MVVGVGHVDVDQAGIRRAVSREQLAGRGSVGLLVSLPESDPQRLAAVVRRTLRGVDGVGASYPTSFGTYVFLTEALVWPAVVEALALAMQTSTVPANLALQVSPGRRRIGDWWSAMREGQVPRPAAFLAFTLTPPLHERDRAPSGEPYGGWGVSAEVTNGLIEHAADWVSHVVGEGEVSDGPQRIAIQPGDAVDVMSQLIDTTYPGFEASFVADSGDGGRYVGFDFWGQATFVTAGIDLDPFHVAQEMTEILRHHAEHLDVGAVRLGVAGVTRNFGYSDRAWLDNRHLWSTRVLQPNAVQILTSAHLDQAHDLTDWTVEKVGKDRWLVSAHDLRPWIQIPAANPPETPHAVIDQAISDFGNMLLTAEWAATNPLAGKFGPSQDHPTP